MGLRVLISSIQRIYLRRPTLQIHPQGLAHRGCLAAPHTIVFCERLLLAAQAGNYPNSPSSDHLYRSYLLA